MVEIIIDSKIPFKCVKTTCVYLPRQTHQIHIKYISRMTAG